MTPPTLLPDLIPLVATVDAVFAPVRRYTDAQGHRALELRDEFEVHGGVPYSPSGDSAERKQANRTADDLEAAGLVEFSRSRGRRKHWRLSDAGEWAMRAYCGLPGVRPMHVALLAIQDNERAGYLNTGHVPETALTGCDWGDRGADDAILLVEQLLAPAFSCGYVGSNSDCEGHVGYALTRAGHKWLACPPPPPSDLPAFSSRANDRYFRLWGDELKRLDSEPCKTVDVHIPLSCGLWPEVRRVSAPPVLTRRGEPRRLADYLRRAKG